MTEEQVAELVAEGVHTGLRKGPDSPEAHALWLAVSENVVAWNEAVQWFVASLEYMDVVVCRVDPL